MLRRYLQALDSGAAVITANARLARVIRRAHGLNKRAEAAAGGPSAWASPAVMPWTSWLESEWRGALYRSSGSAPPILLQGAQEAALWEDAVAASGSASALFDVAAAARSAAAAWDLIHEWRLDLRDPAWGEPEDCAAFLGWARRFEETCRAGNWLSASLLADAVLSSLRAGVCHTAHGLLFAGFDELTPRQREILAALAKAGTGVEVVETSSGEPRGAIRRIGLTDTIAELSAAAQWSRVKLAADPDTSIAVVVPGLAAVRTAVERVFTEVLHPCAALPGGARGAPAFEISLGSPLAGYPLIHAALMAIELEIDPLPLNLVGNLLRSPFFRGGESEAAKRALLDAALRGRGGLDIRVAILRELAAKPPERSKAPACPVLAEILSNWLSHLQTVPARQSCSRWAADISRLLELLGWPGERKLNSEEFQTFQKWQSLLDQFAALDGVVGPRSYRQAAATIRGLARETIFQPESHAAPIQILGPLEAAGQEFGHLWIAGLHGGAWPAAASPHPFIPIRLQREYGLPHSTASRELAYAERITNRLLASAPDVLISYPLRDGDLELRPSRVIGRWPNVELSDLAAEPVPRFADVQFGNAELERLDDSHAPPLPADRAPQGGTAILKEQAACPFRAFARLRLHAGPLDTPQAGLTAIDRGNLVHWALEQIWTRLDSHSALMESSAAALSGLVRSSVATAVGKLLSGGVEYSSRLLAVESELLETLLLEWLQLEKNREPFSILHLEHRERTRLSGVRMNLRADRIDRLADGRHVLIDYKTGSISTAPWDRERPDEPQLPVYATTCGLELSAVAFAQIRRGELRFRGTATSADVLPGAKPSAIEWETQLAEWRSVLEKLAGDFRDGVSAVDPKRPGKTCEHCGLQPLCRIAEASLAADAEEDEELAGAAHA